MSVLRMVLICITLLLLVAPPVYSKAPDARKLPHAGKFYEPKSSQVPAQLPARKVSKPQVRSPIFSGLSTARCAEKDPCWRLEKCIFGIICSDEICPSGTICVAPEDNPEVKEAACVAVEEAKCVSDKKNGSS